MTRLKSILASLAFSTLVTCIGALLAPIAVHAQTTVTMWTFLDPNRPGGREQALKTMIEGFERQNPTIRIRVEPQVWTTLGEKFVLAHSAGNAPDIAWVNMENMGLILNSDSAADLNALIVRNWPADRRADLLLPGWLDALTVNGRLHAMPIMASTWVLMYRRDLLREAGLTPDTLRTWDGVTEAARRMTRRASPDAQPSVWGIGLGLSQERFSATPAVLAAIGAPGGIFGDNCRARLTTPEASRAVQMQADWILRDRVTPREALSMSSDDAIDQFAAGRFAMQIIANSRFEQIQRTAAGWNGAELGMAAVPGSAVDRPGATLISGWSAVAWSRSPRLQQAARFIDYMTSPEAMALWSAPGAQVPMMRSVAARPEMQTAQAAPLRDVAAMFAASGTFMPAACNWARTMADFNLATQQVVLGQRNVADALRVAERATQDRQ